MPSNYTNSNVIFLAQSLMSGTFSVWKFESAGLIELRIIVILKQWDNDKSTHFVFSTNLSIEFHLRIFFESVLLMKFIRFYNRIVGFLMNRFSESLVTTCFCITKIQIITDKIRKLCESLFLIPETCDFEISEYVIILFFRSVYFLIGFPPSIKRLPNDGITIL